MGRDHTDWTACVSFDTKELSQRIQLLWALVWELDASRCPGVGAHQLSNVLESLAPLKQRALLDSIGTHFLGRLRSYGLSTDYLNATSVLSRPLICWFASHGCVRSCQLLIEAGVNADIRELSFKTGNTTALLIAARAGFPECIATLLSGGADPLLADDFGNTVLHETAGSPCSDDHTQLAILQLLLSHPAAPELLALDSKEHSAISQAASRGYTSCVNLLLEAYKPEMRKESASAALFGAAEGGHALATEALIRAGATSRTNQDVDKPSALEAAAEHGHMGCVTIILRSHPTQLDLSNALWTAAAHGHTEAMTVLLEAGASVSHAPSQTHTPPLKAAAQNGHVTCLVMLLDWGAQLGFAAPDGTTALLAAAGGGQTLCVLALLKAGADKDHLDHSGMSAMMLAAAGGHVDVLKCLIKHGAAIERQSFQESGPLLVAAEAGWCEAIDTLLKGGAQASAADARGGTPLMRAAGQGHCLCLDMLLNHDADLDLVDEQGCSALGYAAKGNHRSAVAVLLSWGAFVGPGVVADIFGTFTASAQGSQWGLLQHVSQAEQLQALLSTGDFVALPAGKARNAHQAVATAGPLQEVLQGGMQAVIQGVITGPQGCALIQAMACLISLVKQQHKPKSVTDDNPACSWWRVLQGLHPCLHILCDMAVHQLEALHMATDRRLESLPQPANAEAGICQLLLASTQLPQAQHTQPSAGSSQRSEDAIQDSAALIHASLDLTQLSVLLSTICAAFGGLQHDREHRDAVLNVRSLMVQTSLQHAQLFNEAMEAACRDDAKQGCVVWGWMLEVEGLLQEACWGSMVQGCMQALRVSKHMAMWVPRQDMLEDMCQGFVGGTGFASDISSGLEVQFLNEAGVGSGVRRDWLTSFSQALLDPQAGLFESEDGGHTWQPCPLGHLQDHHLVYFEMLGRAMGLALLHGEVMPGAHFTPNFLKCLLGQPCKLEDLSGNPAVQTFLQGLLAGLYKPEELCLTFSCAHGLGSEVDLVPNGSQLEVTSSNWRDYYNALLAWKLHGSFQAEVQAVRKGLSHVADDRTVQLLHRYATPRILDQLLAGEGLISVKDWQRHALYKHCSASSQPIQWFWSLLHSFDQAQLQALLAFVTCSPVPPAGGFARLAGFNGGRHLFEICLLAQDDARLPRAATCFNTLYLPSYSSKGVMLHRLRQASSAQLVFDEGAVHEVVRPSRSMSRATSPLRRITDGQEDEVV